MRGNQLRRAFTISLTFCVVTYLAVGGLLIYPSLWWVLEPIAIWSGVGAVLFLMPLAMNILRTLLPRRKNPHD